MSKFILALLLIYPLVVSAAQTEHLIIFSLVKLNENQVGMSKKVVDKGLFDKRKSEILAEAGRSAIKSFSGDNVSHHYVRPEACYIAYSKADKNGQTKYYLNNWSKTLEIIEEKKAEKIKLGYKVLYSGCNTVAVDENEVLSVSQSDRSLSKSNSEFKTASVTGFGSTKNNLFAQKNSSKHNNESSSNNAPPKNKSQETLMTNPSQDPSKKVSGFAGLLNDIDELSSQQKGYAGLMADLGRMSVKKGTYKCGQGEGSYKIMQFKSNRYLLKGKTDTATLDISFIGAEGDDLKIMNKLKTKLGEAVSTVCGGSSPGREKSWTNILKKIMHDKLNNCGDAEQPVCIRMYKRAAGIGVRG